MADVSDCIDKMVTAGQVSRALGDEALALFERSRTEFSMQAGPASSAAAAALETAKKMRDRAAARQINIATTVKAFQTGERRIMEDPRGRNAALAGMLSKDTLIGDNRLNALRRAEPDHPIFSGGNADYRAETIKGQMFAMLGSDMEKFKTGLIPSQALIDSSRNFIRERFGVDTGDALSKSVSDGFGKVIDWGTARAKAAGRVFQELEDWRVFQAWTPSRVARFSPDEFVKDFSAEVANGGLKLFDKETGRYAVGAKYDEILRRAHSDIKTEGGSTVPFSKEVRTFEFQPGEPGAKSWLRLQAKYGVGNEIMATAQAHIEHMARSIALHETFGGSPDAVFAALKREVKDDPATAVKGFGWLTSVNTLQHTYDSISGRGNPIANETVARVMAGTRDALGMASLRNLPITIIPGDTAMTQLAAGHLGMDPFKVLAEVLNSGLTKEEALHLQVSAHAYSDFVNNSVRRYEDQINVSGLVRKASRSVVRATGAELWTTNGRQGWQASMLNQLASWRDKAFADLPDNMQNHFFGRYGFSAADWDAIRAAAPFDSGGGARYLDPNAIPASLSERLMMAIKEQGSYAFHQPDARTRALMTGGSAAGSLPGELVRTIGQYKQFTMERMTTHLMRVLTDGPLENRVARGAAFTILSMAAGAVSLQAGMIVAGKDPRDMFNPKFWAEAFVRGGAGGIYGDILGAAFHGDGRTGTSIAAQMVGPVPGFLGDAADLAVAPARQEFDPSGRRSPGETFGNQVFQMAKRWTPQTWYSKLAVDRLIWDKLQTLVDSNYRQSFQRAERNAQKLGAGMWWEQGQSAPSRAPNLGTAFGAR